MTKEDLNLLISLLTEAAEEMQKLGDRPTLWSHYETCQDLGDFLVNAKKNLADDIETDLVELWGIFLPTSDWDNSGGSVHLGNRILKLLKNLYGDVIK